MYILDSELSKFVSYLNVYFPHDEASSGDYIRGIPIEMNPLSESVIVREKNSNFVNLQFY